MKLIVSADDFGLSIPVNEAIVRAFEMGTIDRATAIANAPCFADACQRAHERKLGDRIGIHFNLTEGMALSRELADSQVFCGDDSRFTYQRNARRHLSKNEMNAVSAECEAQILKFHEVGLRPTHLDSHHHVHTEWFVFRAVEPVLRRHRFSSVRLSNNTCASSLPQRTYKQLFNHYLMWKNWASSDFFGAAPDLEKLAASPDARNAVVEVMVHPVMDSQDKVIDALFGNELAPEINNLKSRFHLG